MNRILLTISAFLSTLILASVVFVTFFHYDNRAQARALIVVAPTSVMGATAIDTVTRTAVALATTDDFRARFINDLTTSGTVFNEEELTQTVFRQETPGLISVTAFARNEDAPIARIATSGAYSLMHTMQAYFETASVYTFTVIDGAHVTQSARMGLALRLVLSGLIGALSTALIFATVFSVRTVRGTGRRHRYHGHIHASQAQIDLKLPQDKQNVADDYDYMRDMYADYDASLENLNNVQSVKLNEEGLAEEVRSYDEEDSVVDKAQTIQENAQKAAVEEAPLDEKNEDDVPKETPLAVPSQQENAIAPRTATHLQKAQEKSAQKTLQATKDLARRTQHASREKVAHSLRALGALFRSDENTTVTQNIQKAQRQDVQKKAQNDVNQEEDAGSKQKNVARTASPPPNLPTMSLSRMEDTDNAMKDKSGSDGDDATHEPTSEEVRKRLNELLSGKPPKVSS